MKIAFTEGEHEKVVKCCDLLVKLMDLQNNRKWGIKGIYYEEVVAI